MRISEKQISPLTQQAEQINGNDAATDDNSSISNGKTFTEKGN